jgi:hypothetical protein
MDFLGSSRDISIIFVAHPHAIDVSLSDNC